MPRASTSKTSKSEAGRAPETERLIDEEEACSRFCLGRTDLDSVEPNAPKNGQILKHSLRDVKRIHAKVAEMVKTLQAGTPAGKVVPRIAGGTLTRTEAKERYHLEDNQINRIRPCKVKVIERDGCEFTMRIYNTADVKALSQGIAQLGDTKSNQVASIARDAMSHREFLDEFYNPFDGDPDDADALLASILHP
ncbi:unnamed protein product [Peniophora sp. CBMAI 1063]|nr:unnamed protein product [Peniophora sp. CBMAI 1063]